MGVVILDEELAVIEEFDTLINPGRDVGPTGIHGVTAGMVSAAPTFDEVAGLLAFHLDECVLVAHNLAFDVRMLNQEFARIGSRLEAGRGFDTLHHTGTRLDRACETFGIDHGQAHRALSDARSVAELLKAFARTWTIERAPGCSTLRSHRLTAHSAAKRFRATKR